MKILPYLVFDGNCAEAFRFYEKCLGGSLEVMTHGESPMAAETPPGSRDRVMHAYLRAGDAELMGSDGMAGSHAGPGDFSVSVHVDDPAEAERVFAALAEGGRETMPIAPTFWASRFGMLVDRFGVHWMVNCPLSQ